MLVLALALFATHPAGAVTTNIFSTQFEPSEGYSIDLDLVGQNGWQGEGSGGNGILTNFFEDRGQQAYLGYFPPNTNDDQLVVWRPINFTPLAANLPVVEFSVLMSIVDSSNTNYDNFRWSVYNTAGHRLFTLDFDNYELSIKYLLDGSTNFVDTGWGFDPDEVYTLLVRMNFASNLWNAALGGELIVTNKPITTTGAAPTLGDVDAVWLVFDPDAPGDNYLLFDDYRIAAEVPAPPRPRMNLIERTPAGHVFLRLEGASGVRFAIDATTNFSTWTPLRTNVISDGFFDYLDTSAAGLARRYYRARWVP